MDGLADGITNVPHVCRPAEIDNTAGVIHGRSEHEHVPMPWQSKVTTNEQILRGVSITVPKDDERSRTKGPRGCDSYHLEVHSGFRFEEVEAVGNPHQGVRVVDVRIWVSGRLHSDKIPGITMDAERIKVARLCTVEHRQQHCANMMRGRTNGGIVRGWEQSFRTSHVYILKARLSEMDQV